MGTVALGIRNVVCVPLNFVQYVESAEARGEDRRIGVLYLDSREKGTLLSEATRAALETLAAEASVAIENARLYREKLEKAKMEQEMRIAAEIQQALLPKPRASLGLRRGRGRQHSVPLDRRRLLRLPRRAGHVVRLHARRRRRQGAAGRAHERADAGHVRGAGARMPTGPAPAVDAHEQGAVPAWPRVAVRHADVRHRQRRGHADVLQRRPQSAVRHRQVAASAGSRRAVRSSACSSSRRTAQETVQLEPGDTIVVFSDGVSEALNTAGDEFGDARLQEVAAGRRRGRRRRIVERIVAAVRVFTKGAAQSDDITVMVIRYLGAGA